LIFLFDADAEGRGHHGQSRFHNKGWQVQPPPAVTLSRAAVDSRVRQPSHIARPNEGVGVEHPEYLHPAIGQARVGLGLNLTRFWTM
jgi:hypothetical protein